MSFEQIHTFLPFTILGFFDIIASMLTHIPCHKSSSCWSLISGPFFSLLLPVYLLSSPFSSLYSIHTYISTYHWYLRICEIFFFLIYKNPLRSFLFFRTVTSADIVSLCYTFTNNVLPSFFCIFFSQLCIIFLTEQQHSLLSFAFLFVDWYQFTLLSLAWTSVYHHTHHTPHHFRAPWQPRSLGPFLYFFT